jgi:hypothetical protein
VKSLAAALAIISLSLAGCARSGELKEADAGVPTSTTAAPTAVVPPTVTTTVPAQPWSNSPVFFTSLDDWRYRFVPEFPDGEMSVSLDVADSPPGKARLKVSFPATWSAYSTSTPQPPSQEYKYLIGDTPGRNPPNKMRTVYRVLFGGELKPPFFEGDAQCVNPGDVLIDSFPKLQNGSICVFDHRAVDSSLSLEMNEADAAEAVKFFSSTTEQAWLVVALFPGCSPAALYLSSGEILLGNGGDDGRCPASR